VNRILELHNSLIPRPPNSLIKADGFDLMSKYTRRDGLLSFMSLVLTLLYARYAPAAKLIRLWRTQTVAAVFRSSSHSSVTKTEPKSLKPVHPFFVLIVLVISFTFNFSFLILIKADGSISVACTGNCYSVGSRSGRLRSGIG